ncbi:MAG TPA: hypothetical protein VLV87_04460 [Gammaproteobacteria bacterium]|nr:hypothetical protein [Gammaproteobacteria bacterium]
MRVSVHIIMLAFCLLAAPMAGAAPAKPATPIDAKNSTRAFQKTTMGGIQQLLAKDPNDKALVTAIRDSMEAEAARFGTGDYGKDTPGARYLSMIKPGQLRITYRQVPGGAAVDYQGRDAATIDAIHKWLDVEIDAQYADTAD